MKRVLIILLVLISYVSFGQGQGALLKRLLLSQSEVGSSLRCITSNSSTGSSVSLSYGCTMYADNVAFIFIVDKDADTFTTPLGWTSVAQKENYSPYSEAIFWKRMTGGESGNVTVSSASSDGDLIAGIMIVLSGLVDTSYPYTSFVDNEFTTSNQTSMSISTSECQVYYSNSIGLVFHANASGSYPNATSTWETTTFNNSGAGLSIAVSYYVDPPTGNSPALSYTWSVGTNRSTYHYIECIE